MQKNSAIPLLISTLLVTIAISTGGAAQSNAPQQTYSVSVIQVKPEMGAEWQAYLKEANAALQKGGVKQRSVWTTTTLGQGGEYIVVTPLASLADYDNPSPLVKALGQEGAAALTAKRQRLITSAHTYMITARPDLGIASKEGYLPKMAVAATVNVQPGKTAEYEKSTKELSAVAAKTNAKGVLVGKVGLGGDPNSYISLYLFDNWTDLSKFPDEYSKAAAAAKLAPVPSGIVAHTEWRVYRFAADLSIIPAPQK